MTVTTTKPPTLVALDIDGTLIDDHGRISPAVVAALWEVRAAGHHIVLSTGRSLVGVLPIADALRLTDCWVVASNGAVTAVLRGSRYELTRVRHVDVQTAARLVLAPLPHARLAAEVIGVGYRVTEEFPDHELNGKQIVVPLEELWAEPSPRMVVRGAGAGGLRNALKVLDMTAVPDYRSHSDWLDITDRGVTKATALEKVRADLRVPAECTLAVGDGLNDVEMLRWAARGVAMGQAPQAVRDAADAVTDRVEEGGAALVLRSLLTSDASAVGVP